jgi:hypothetical protein
MRPVFVAAVGIAGILHFKIGYSRLRVKNAGCNEDVAVEPTEF